MVVAYRLSYCAFGSCWQADQFPQIVGDWKMIKAMIMHSFSCLDFFPLGFIQTSFLKRRLLSYIKPRRFRSFKWSLIGAIFGMDAIVSTP